MTSRRDFPAGETTFPWIAPICSLGYLGEVHSEECTCSSKWACSANIRAERGRSVSSGLVYFKRTHFKHDQYVVTIKSFLFWHNLRSLLGGIAVWMWKVSLKLVCLNTWSPGSIVRECYRIFGKWRLAGWRTWFGVGIYSWVLIPALSLCFLWVKEMWLTNFILLLPCCLFRNGRCPSGIQVGGKIKPFFLNLHFFQGILLTEK